MLVKPFKDNLPNSIVYPMYVQQVMNNSEWDQLDDYIGFVFEINNKKVFIPIDRFIIGDKFVVSLAPREIDYDRIFNDVICYYAINTSERIKERNMIHIHETAYKCVNSIKTHFRLIGEYGSYETYKKQYTSNLFESR